MKGTERKRPRPDEPDEIEGDMTKPDWLGPIASAKWDEMVPVLVARKTVSPAYADFLAVYCQAHQDLHDAMETIERDGMYIVSEKGGMYQHPAVGVKHKAIDRIGKFGREFGLSPTSIRDIKVNGPKETPNKKKRFFAG